MVGHHDTGPSVMSRIWECPGSVLLAREFGLKSKGSYDAAEGTVAHALASYTLMYLFGQDTSKCEYQPHMTHMEVDEFVIEIDQEMHDNVAIYCQYIRALAGKYGVSQVDVETQVHIPPVNVFGTADVKFYADFPFNRLACVDFKYGKGQPVSVVNNKQGLMYLLGAYYDLSEEERAEVYDCVFTIVQPRFYGAVDNGIAEWVFPVSVLMQFQAELIEKLAIAEAPGAPLVAGDHCRWCPAKPKCNVWTSYISSAAEHDFADLPAVPTALPAPQTMTNDTMLRIWEHRKHIEDWLDSIGGYLTGLAANGDLPGYRVKQNYGNRYWIDEPQAVRELTELMKAEAYEPAKLKTPAKVEAWLKKTKTVSTILTRLVDRKPSSMSLEKGECLESRAESDFKNLPAAEA